MTEQETKNLEVCSARNPKARVAQVKEFIEVSPTAWRLGLRHMKAGSLVLAVPHAGANVGSWDITPLADPKDLCVTVFDADISFPHAYTQSSHEK